jgi:hypothetical protein
MGNPLHKLYVPYKLDCLNSGSLWYEMSLLYNAKITLAVMISDFAFLPGLLHHRLVQPQLYVLATKFARGDELFSYKNKVTEFDKCFNRLPHKTLIMQSCGPLG